jgi:hypothetical protein
LREIDLQVESTKPINFKALYLFNPSPIKINLTMKNSLKTVLMTFLAFAAVVAFAQGDKKMPSPPAKAEGKSGAAAITIDYHQPSAKGRKMLGGINPYGEVWRTGANKTTTITVSAPVKIEGQDLAAGTYGLFTIPGENEWTIIINKGVAWGAYSYKDSEDVLRVKVKPGKTAAFVETFNISVENDQVVLKWENTQVAFKVKG